MKGNNQTYKIIRCIYKVY